jgi:hypothetical protein
MHGGWGFFAEAVLNGRPRVAVGFAHRVEQIAGDLFAPGAALVRRGSTLVRAATSVTCISRRKPMPKPPGASAGTGNLSAV